ncbi:hypothetical protein LMG33818_000077 [Halomonadaceae bacterium LMG 33818]|uniref:DUF6314 family protein n=1 Tax=Cernens ardua TaxID=3402176 RepID=UPI003EDC9F30
MTAIIELGKRIGQITRVEFSASTQQGSRTGWNGEGHGKVEVTSSLQGEYRVVYLKETGKFCLRGARPVSFKNVYRLTWYANRISLHHERRGKEHAVWLFDLTRDQDNPDVLLSEEPHLCGSDHYSAVLKLSPQGFILNWTIQGARKNERLAYHYW